MQLFFFFFPMTLLNLCLKHQERCQWSGVFFTWMHLVLPCANAGGCETALCLFLNKYHSQWVKVLPTDSSDTGKSISWSWPFGKEISVYRAFQVMLSNSSEFCLPTAGQWMVTIEWKWRQLMHITSMAGDGRNLDRQMRRRSLHG